MLRIRNLTESALCAAIIAVMAQIVLPLPAVPMTLQTLGVAFCGYYLGMGRGCLVVAVYLLLGGVGLPVFSVLSGGFSALIGPAAGYLWGFLPLAILCGVKGGAPIRVGLGALGLILCHGIGTLWYGYSTNIGFSVALMSVSVPTIWKDILSLGLAFILAERIKKILNR